MLSSTLLVLVVLITPLIFCEHYTAYQFINSSCVPVPDGTCTQLSETSSIKTSCTKNDCNLMIYNNTDCSTTVQQDKKLIPGDCEDIGAYIEQTFEIPIDGQKYYFFAGPPGDATYPNFFIAMMIFVPTFLCCILIVIALALLRLEKRRRNKKKKTIEDQLKKRKSERKEETSRLYTVVV